ncbi:MAG TPA: TIGR00645 family protein [Burkholderiales bacterium]|nr:TIGR00645 family protein [Burkholderiales bacterium]
MKNTPLYSAGTLGILPRWIFMSRWLQAPLYVGLIVAQGLYVWQFWTELVHLISLMSVKNISETEIMLIVLGLIDVVMISNLLVMVIVGGWETFVSRLELEKHPDQPEWLSHVNAGVLKVKLATAIIGISSIHLLKTFINAANYDEKTLLWQTAIHLAFVTSAIAIAYTEKLTHATAQAQKHHKNGTAKAVESPQPGV